MSSGPSTPNREHTAMALRRPYLSIKAPPTNAPTKEPSFRAPTMLDCKVAAGSREQTGGLAARRRQGAESVHEGPLGA